MRGESLCWVSCQGTRLSVQAVETESVTDSSRNIVGILIVVGLVLECSSAILAFSGFGELHEIS